MPRRAARAAAWLVAATVIALGAAGLVAALDQRSELSRIVRGVETEG